MRQRLYDSFSNLVSGAVAWLKELLVLHHHQNSWLMQLVSLWRKALLLVCLISRAVQTAAGLTGEWCRGCYSQQLLPAHSHIQHHAE
jgi:hypothetical protein